MDLLEEMHQSKERKTSVTLIGSPGVQKITYLFWYIYMVVQASKGLYKEFSSVEEKNKGSFFIFRDTASSVKLLTCCYVGS
jgi:hypothetical protein